MDDLFEQLSYDAAVKITEGKGLDSFKYQNYSVANQAVVKRVTAKMLTIPSKLQTLKTKYVSGLRQLLRRVRSNKMMPDSINALGTRLVQNYFTEAYLLGLRSGGVNIKTIALVKPQDRQYLNRIVQEESGFLYRYILQVFNGTAAASKDEHRLQMYAASLNAIYQTGKVNSLPSNTLIFWRGKLDSSTCASCSYLLKNSPYLPSTLPTTPQSDLTLCMSNCRCKLGIINSNAFPKSVRRANRRKKSVHLTTLNSILRRHGRRA